MACVRSGARWTTLRGDHPRVSARGGVITQVIVFRDGAGGSGGNNGYGDDFGAYVLTPAGGHDMSASTPPGGRGIILTGDPHERITFLAYSIGDLHQREMHISLGDQGTIVGMTSGEGGLVVRGRDMGGVSAGVNAVYAGAHAGVLGRFELDVKHHFFGAFGPKVMALEPGARPLILEDGSGVRLCPCVFEDLSGPRSLGQGHATFVRNEAGASVLWAEPAVLYGVDAFFPAVE